MQLFCFLGETLHPVHAQLRLRLAIEDVLAEVEQALVLTHALYFLLEVPQLVQTHLEVVEEVGEGALHAIQVVDVLLVQPRAFKRAHCLRKLLTALRQYLLGFTDLDLVTRDVAFEHLDFNEALLCFVNVDVLVHVGRQARMAVARRDPAIAELVPAPERQATARVKHAAVGLLLGLQPGKLVVVALRRHGRAVAAAPGRHWVPIHATLMMLLSRRRVATGAVLLHGLAVQLNLQECRADELARV